MRLNFINLFMHYPLPDAEVIGNFGEKNERSVEQHPRIIMDIEQDNPECDGERYRNDHEHVDEGMRKGRALG